MILVFVWNEVSRTKSRTHKLITRLRTPNSWEDFSENQCITLVAIADLYKNEPFSHEEFKEEVESEGIGSKFGEDATVDTKERTLVLLRIRNLLTRVDGKYKINEGHGGVVLQDYYNQLDEEAKDQISISWA